MEHHGTCGYPASHTPATSSQIACLTPHSLSVALRHRDAQRKIQFVFISAYNRISTHYPINTFFNWNQPALFVNQPIGDFKSCHFKCVCALGILSFLTYTATCDACVTSTDVSKAYKVALGGDLFAWGSN